MDVSVDFQELDFTHLASEDIEPYSTPHLYGNDRQYIGESNFLRLFGVFTDPSVLESIRDIMKLVRRKPLTTPFSESDLTSKLVEAKIASDLESATQLVPVVLQKKFCETEHYGHYQIEEVNSEDGSKKYLFRQNLDTLIFPK